MFAWSVLNYASKLFSWRSRKKNMFLFFHDRRHAQKKKGILLCVYFLLSPFLFNSSLSSLGRRGSCEGHKKHIFKNISDLEKKAFKPFLYGSYPCASNISRGDEQGLQKEISLVCSSICAFTRMPDRSNWFTWMPNRSVFLPSIHWINDASKQAMSSGTSFLKWSTPLSEYRSLTSMAVSPWLPRWPCVTVWTRWCLFDVQLCVALCLYEAVKMLCGQVSLTKLLFMWLGYGIFVMKEYVLLCAMSVQVWGIHLHSNLPF